MYEEEEEGEEGLQRRRKGDWTGDLCYEVPERGRERGFELFLPVDIQLQTH